MDKKIKLLIAITVIIFIILIVAVCKIFFFNNEEEVIEVEEEVVEQQEEEPQAKEEIKIFNGDDRPIAFMIDNNVNAQPQSALNQAYLVYEILVEGGETRLMALFKGINVSENDVTVGPIRSARHYFVDYALENDAIYTHLGQSPQAETAIVNYKVSSINGQTYDTGKAKTSSSLFWRENSKKSPHNAYTSIRSIKEICDKKSYKTTSSKDSLLNYVTKEVKHDEQAISAETVTIPFSNSNVVQYVYNPLTGRYTRYSKDTKQVDELTGEDVTTKNIIISCIKNYELDDGENKGRQELNNKTNATGYYITNGKAIKILCKKESFGGQTEYVDELGNEIEVNDGNMWVCVCPVDAGIKFE